MPGENKINSVAWRIRRPQRSIGNLITLQTGSTPNKE